jgi:hypothetical protein
LRYFSPINRSLSVRLLKSQPLFLQAKPYLAHARKNNGSATATLSRGALALPLRMIGTPKQQVDAEDLSITSDFKELLSTGMIHPLQNSATSINVDESSRYLTAL